MSHIGVMLPALELVWEAAVGFRTPEHVQAADLCGQLRSVDGVAAVVLILDFAILSIDSRGHPRKTSRSASAGAGRGQAAEGEEDRRRGSSDFVAIKALEAGVSDLPIQTCEEELAREVVAGLEMTVSSCMNGWDSYCHSKVRGR